jgi:hypothetical protein
MKNVNTTLAFAAVLAVVTIFTEAALADVIPPIGLAPGSSYQLIFVTDSTTNAMSSDINYYNSIVQTEAAGDPLLPLATWTAVAVTYGTAGDYESNSPVYLGIPVYNVMGREVASNSAAPCNIFNSSLWLNPVGYDGGGRHSTPTFGPATRSCDTSGASPPSWIVGIPRTAASTAAPA